MHKFKLQIWKLWIWCFSGPGFCSVPSKRCSRKRCRQQQECQKCVRNASKMRQKSGDSRTVICKPCSENSWTKGWTRGGQSRSARNSLKSPFFQSPLIRSWKMRQNGSCFIGKRGTFQNASKMRGTPLGENTFWTIPICSARQMLSGEASFILLVRCLSIWTGASQS